MLGKVTFCLWMMLITLAFTPLQPAQAADFNIHLHLYTVDGVAVGEICLEDRVAFKLQIAKDGTMPVISMEKGNTDTVIAPDIVNGMFMLRFNKE